MSDSSLADHILTYARKSGADQADIMISRSENTEVTQRLGNRESVQRSENTDIGIRVMIGQRQAMVSSADTDRKTLEALTDQAIEMARAVPEDPYVGLEATYADPNFDMDLDLVDHTDFDAEKLLEMARETEDAARNVEGVTNSEGADAYHSRSAVFYATSTGFSGEKQGTSSGVSISVLAGAGEHMQRDYDYTSARHADDLKSPADIGRQAAERTVARMNPRKVKSQKVPVIYDRRISTSIIGHLAGGISGSSIARGTSLLKDKMDQGVCAPHITICDDPYLKRGMKSKYFDGEGLIPQKRNIIDGGRLTGWLLDLKSARQLKLDPTANASRSASGQPSPSTHNFYMQPGDQSPEDMIAEIENGFYVTELMGSSVNMLTGDYSRGAAGFWIENGQITYPVSEITVAGNLLEIWQNMMPANDLIFERGVEVPTLRIDGMTIAGN